MKKKLEDTDNRIRIFNICPIEFPERVRKEEGSERGKTLANPLKNQ